MWMVNRLITPSFRAAAVDHGFGLFNIHGESLKFTFTRSADNEVCTRLGFGYFTMSLPCKFETPGFDKNPPDSSAQCLLCIDEIYLFSY